ncbi:hypothetical protein BGZ58_004793, partial [Dissophora ornata]
MFIKSTSIAVVALVAAATVSAQTPDHTYFTNPVTDGLSYNEGDNATFSWQMACVTPSTSTSTTPTAVQVQLINSTDTNNAFYLAPVTTIDCSKSQGNNAWIVPTGDANTLYSLKIVLDPTPIYSGKFKIVSKSSSTTTTTTTTTGSTTAAKSAAGTLTAPFMTGAALVASAAAAM